MLFDSACNVTTHLVWTKASPWETVSWKVSADWRAKEPNVKKVKWSEFLTPAKMTS